MRKIPCINGDLALMYLHPSCGGYPRKRWWAFWEKRMSREEWLESEHEFYMSERKCHTWKGQDFHFCQQ